jgi:hypothetical protein
VVERPIPPWPGSSRLGGQAAGLTGAAVRPETAHTVMVRGAGYQGPDPAGDAAR